ncbi:hypothetical protein JTE90_028074 [Oedothorax gibbosus]|uniref:Uncharacterized protein n=1 Tax=Oedothorax gibbosus TaxID=931172 RepID=A0AAV6VAG8_9ARAC|nr:hypothetical protein JTE90_028074 [Oedothorax gibbosus]
MVCIAIVEEYRPFGGIWRQNDQDYYTDPHGKHYHKLPYTSTIASPLNIQDPAVSNDPQNLFRHFPQDQEDNAEEINPHSPPNFLFPPYLHLGSQSLALVLPAFYGH